MDLMISIIVAGFPRIKGFNFCEILKSHTVSIFKNMERRAGLRFDRIREKLNYAKRFSDNIEKKIKDDLFFIETIGLGPRRFHCFTEFFTGT